MNRIRRILAVAAASAALAVSAGAQHEEHQAGGGAAANGPAMGCPGMGGGMAEKGSDHAKLMEDLMKSMAAMQAEKKIPAALKQKLAAHAALLKQLGESHGSGGMMPMAPGCCDRK